MSTKALHFNEGEAHFCTYAFMHHRDLIQLRIAIHLMILQLKTMGHLVFILNFIQYWHAGHSRSFLQEMSQEWYLT